MTRINAGRVTLRPFHTDDVQLVIEASRDPFIPLITSMPEHADTDQAQAWIELQRTRVTSGIGYWVLAAHRHRGLVLLSRGARAVARVASSVALLESVRRELRVASRLAEAGVPAVRALVAEPFVDGELVVSLWEYLPEVEATDVVTLAGFLRRLHAIPVPRDLRLDPVRPFVRIAERIESASTLTEVDRQLLRAMHAELVASWGRARFEMAVTVVHGDAHNDNLVRTGDGRIVFLDLERVGVGQPEWDLTLTATYHECGWRSATDYAAFVDAYGYDVRTAPAWPLLKAIRMLRMVTWLAAAAADDPARTAQVRFRMATLRDGTAPAGWDGF